jgi:hypothetical protein
MIWAEGPLVQIILYSVVVGERFCSSHPVDEDQQLPRKVLER